MDQQRLFIKAQRHEITEYHIYHFLAKRVKSKHNRQILKKIAEDELHHYSLLKEVSKQEVKPNMSKVYWTYFLSTIFGLAFSLRLVEKGEQTAIQLYMKSRHKSFAKLLLDEQKHEQQLLDLIKDVRLDYAGSIVLGLSDALVELSGALAGLTFALGDGKLVAIIGFITGFAASLSMAASEYLSSKEETEYNPLKSPLKGAIYTGITYISTVIVLILPYLFISNVYAAFTVMLSSSVIIIALYTFYMSTAKNRSFSKRFFEMALITVCVAFISFGIGWLLRTYVGIEI